MFEKDYDDLIWVIHFQPTQFPIHPVHDFVSDSKLGLGFLLEFGVVELGVVELGVVAAGDGEH